MNRRWVRYLVSAGIGLVLGGTVLAFIAYQERWSPKDPMEVAKRSIVGTLQSPNFRFESTFLVRVDGREEVVSRFTGERSGGEKFHFKGVMLQSPAEIYLVGNLFYLWDPGKKSWYSLEKNRFGPQDLLLSEISPLSALDIRNINSATFVGKEKTRDEECLVLDCSTEVSNRLLTALWKDFSYRLWVDPWKNVVRKGVIEATSRNAPRDKLILTVEFWDYGEKLAVDPPPVAKK